MTLSRRNLFRTDLVGTAAAAGLTAAQVKSADKKTSTENWDVVVVGAGFAGMCAALEAAERGAKTILLEKMGRPRRHDRLFVRLDCRRRQPFPKRTPGHARSFSLNPMTTAMVRHLAVRRPPKVRAEAIARVILDELLETRHLPINTAPFPNDERLQHIALACTARETVRYTNFDWATKEAMSERTLTRLVKKETGLTLADWILSIRLWGAVNDLINGETVEETAWNTGYENPSAFIRRFRRQFGMTPGQFRSEQTA